MTIDPELTGDAVESESVETGQITDLVPQADSCSAHPSRKRKRKFDKSKPLDSPEDEAIAQYRATPKSVRDFKSLTDLARHFNISRMTVYRRSKELSVLQRAEWLLQHHMLAGDLIPRLHWERIMAGQVRAAAAGDTRAAQLCKERAWPDGSAVIDTLAKQVLGS
jgi:hypothetical protein